MGEKNVCLLMFLIAVPADSARCRAILEEK